MSRSRCAIYTRKSSEEGLDQDYNSLDAQRDACLSFIRSQKGEGWTAVPTRYDDGGWSGGTMERPALRRLLADIEAGLIDIVVVYKVDRLTRSLADFARIIDILDRGGASFVSVTQQFNTTSSMGRLTLNILLSFAQFEREVTGERIRDKIAASKARGMWMGGIPPLGYVPSGRTLEVVPREADLVRAIFQRYLAAGSVHQLRSELEAEGVRSKRWTTARGVVRGGVPLSRGALFHLLRNKVYLGEIVHKGKTFPGQHEAIVARETFDAVQAMLLSKGAKRTEASGEAALLTGMLFDAEGHRMTPAHSRGRSGRRYRYYVSAPLQKGGAVADHVRGRVSAPLIDELVIDRVRRWSGREHADRAALLATVRRVELHDRAVRLVIDPPAHECWPDRIVDPDRVERLKDGTLAVSVPALLARRSGRGGIAINARDRHGRRLDRTLIDGLKRAHATLDAHGVELGSSGAMFADARGIDDPYLRRLVRLAFLAPDIQKAILTGRQPVDLDLPMLLAADIPLDWDAQRFAFGF